MQREAVQNFKKAMANYSRHIAFLVAFALELNASSAMAQIGYSIGKFPVLMGSSRSESVHPRVFTSAEDLIELKKRVGEKNSFSAAMFTRLALDVTRDFNSNVDWSAVYSGCDLDTYLRIFSIESTGGYSSELRSDNQIRTVVHIKSNKAIPRGAAVVAARLALYAALVDSQSALPTSAPSKESAIRLSRQILLAWAKGGFRSNAGSGYMSSPGQFCANGQVSRPVETTVGLQVSRGILYSVAAQDLLMGLSALDASAVKSLDAFHGAMYDLIRSAHNFDLSGLSAWREDCERYSNHIGSQLTALLAIARLLNSESQFDAALKGGGDAISVRLPWIAYFNLAIYGNGAKVNACYENSGRDGYSSRPSFDTGSAALGEVDDRNRNLNAEQGIGYPMLALERLFDAAELLRIAGFDAYSYRGLNGQSIESVARFYSCYAIGAGFGGVVSAENSSVCLNFPQYAGKIVNGVERNLVIGAFRFPHDEQIVKLELQAKELAGPALVDPLLFGRWRD